MTLTRKSIVRTIGQRTRLPNPQVELMLEALIDLWMEALGQGERIEIEDFLILEAVWIRHSGGGRLQQGQVVKAGYKVVLRTRPGKKLYQLLRQKGPSHFKD
ncbi:MAG: HU family DNA-binding protein [Anaerolineae bacterium]|nr:MAG: HU family DNA-binding protein [Anaerolineae bacterium]